MKVRITHRRARELVRAPLNLSGGENLVAETGAKMSYLGGGWWLLLGYSWDGRDLQLPINR